MKSVIVFIHTNSIGHFDWANMTTSNLFFYLVLSVQCSFHRIKELILIDQTVGPLLCKEIVGSNLRVLWVQPCKRCRMIQAISKSFILSNNFFLPHNLGPRSVTFSSVHSQQTCRHPLPSFSSLAPKKHRKSAVLLVQLHQNNMQLAIWKHLCWL